MQGIKTKKIVNQKTGNESVKAMTTGERSTSMSLQYDYALSAEQNHAKVAKALFKKLGWHKDGEPHSATATDIKGGYFFAFDYGHNRVNFK